MQEKDRSTKGKEGQPRRRKAPPSTPLSKLLARFSDGLLIFGDAVMIGATETASDRMPWQAMPLCAAVLVGAWVTAAVLRGDYDRSGEDETTSLSAALGLPLIVAMSEAMLTWALATPLALAAFASLVSTAHLDPEVLVKAAEGHGLAPQMEINLALLVVMTAWRAIAVRLRQ